jgi:O-methyltransferase
MPQSKTLRAVALNLLDEMGGRSAARWARATIRKPVQNTVRGIKARTQWGWGSLVPEAEFTDCCVRAIRELRALDPREPTGDYLEFGVSRGTSLACTSRALASENALDVRMFGFDSFRGLPPEAAHEGWKPGTFHSSKRATEAYLRQHATNLNRILLIDGWFSDTLNHSTRIKHGLSHVSLVMLDCDTYTASRDALRFTAPLIRDRAVIFCDDWGAKSSQRRAGQKEAFEEFLNDSKTLNARQLPSYCSSARVFLLHRNEARA